MRKLFVLLMCLASLATYAQNSGLGFNYQAVVRKTDGVLLANADVNLRISLYPGQSASNPTWVETHLVRTDYAGCFGITVGKGTRASNSVAASYKDINFSSVYYWMKIELLEGNNYREVSFAQLPSAPYSESAFNAIAFPAGMIVPFAGPAENIPEGWLLCDGSAVSRNDYANLYTAIGVCWGTGDGATTFNLPDLRGMFLRGVSGESGNDADADNRILLTDNGGNTGNNVGSYQGDAIRNITGNFNGVDRNSLIGKTTQGVFYTQSGKYQGCGDGDEDNALVYFDTSRVVPVGSDNRPKNVYVTYIIKY
jgi:microcystin-dependent protein